MDRLTLKQYADTLQLSYEAVRQSFKTHQGKDLLEGLHYIRTGRTTRLTAAGIDAMNTFRQKAVIVLPGDAAALEDKIRGLEEQVQDRDEQIRVLTSENAELRLQLVALRTDLDGTKDSLIQTLLQLQNANAALIEAKDTPKRGFWRRLFGR